MSQQPAEQLPPLALPARINEGMAVHDRDEQPVGVVQLVYYGGASDEAIARTLQLSENAAPGEAGWGAFGDDGVPMAMRERLLRNGYIRVEGAGITGVRAYATAEQIADVTDERVLLRASSAELIGA